MSKEHLFTTPEQADDADDRNLADNGFLRFRVPASQDVRVRALSAGAGLECRVAGGVYSIHGPTDVVIQFRSNFPEIYPDRAPH